MNNPRVYGHPPYSLALIHGGPGAGGEMAPVARRLGASRGVLEPIQTADSLEGQIHELKGQLEQNASLPVVLAGYSWGAWLAFLVAAIHPKLVKKLVLISSGSFDAAYMAGFERRRLERLSPEEQQEAADLAGMLDDPLVQAKSEALARFGALFAKTDSFDPLPSEESDADKIPPRPDIFRKVWADADKMRRAGTLLELGRAIECPVAAIHGDYDPHPIKGVEEPLTRVLKDFRLLLLKECGHTPWLEKRAKEEFYTVLMKELE
jgi:pimeloyl-ACP methyl ester carboxylesterase